MSPSEYILSDLTVSRCTASALAERIRIGEAAIEIILKRLEREGVVMQQQIAGQTLVAWSLVDLSKVVYRIPQASTPQTT